jgi:drug/metabolite transporter (DMT)-like permease
MGLRRAGVALTLAVRGVPGGSGMAFILLGCVGLIWGLSYPITALALRGFDILTLRSLIQLLGACAMLGQTLAFGRSFRVEREAWPDLWIAALLNMTLLPLSFTLGVYLLGPGRTSVLVYSMPIWASLFARILLGERLTLARAAALVLGAAAVAALMSQSLPELRDAPLGGAVTLFSAMSYGLGTVWLKRRVWRADIAAIVFWQLAVGTLPILVLWFLLRFPPNLAHTSAEQWLAALFLGVVGNGFAYFAWFRVVALLPAGAAGVGALLTPAIAVASSVWLAGETLHPHDVAAIALIGAALILVVLEQLARRRDTKAPADPARQSGRL